MNSIFKWLLVLSMVIFVGFVMGNFFVGKMVYPVPWIKVDYPNFPLVEINLTICENTDIVCWMDSTFAKQRPFFIYFHGNAENLETLKLSGFFSQLKRLEVNAFVIDYPGYGRSGGKPSEKTILEAANHAVLWVKRNFPENIIVVCGWSLGAAVAIQVVANNSDSVDKLVMLSPWSSLPAVAADHFPSFLVKWVLQEKYNSLEAIKYIHKPVLLVHGLNDHIIPVYHSHQLIQNMQSSPMFFEIPNVGHNDLLNQSIVWHKIAIFLDDKEIM
jgi:pimeloyl-ACP methyl ester carboxylesterase